MILKYGGVEYTFQLAMCRANLARVAWGQGGGGRWEGLGQVGFPLYGLLVQHAPLLTGPQLWER